MPFIFFNIVKTHFSYTFLMYEIKLHTHTHTKQNQKNTTQNKNRNPVGSKLFLMKIIGRMKDSKRSDTCIKATHFAIRCQSYLSTVEFFLDVN